MPQARKGTEADANAVCSIINDASSQLTDVESWTVARFNQV